MMKQTIKNFLGARNALKIIMLRKFSRTSTNRFIRAVYGKKESFTSLKTRIFALPEANMFFGYYEVPQFSHDENKFLAMVAPLINRTPGPDDILRVGFFDLGNKRNEFQEIGSTNTWCWQQGCRLQWYPFSGNQTVLYNTIVNGKYGCVIQDVNTGNIVKSFNRPAYAVSRDGKWGLSLDFSRLQRLRPGYGYNMFPDISADEPAPVKDGIWRLDMKTGDEKLLFSVNDIAGVSADKPVDEAEHYFNHILFNPVGNRFMFFHIRQLPDNKRNIRLFTCGIDGSGLQMLNNSGFVSHYCWKDNNHLLVYARVPDRGTGYYLYNDNTGEIQAVGDGLLSEDGHPSFLPDERHLLTDTYPNKYGEQSLLLYNYKDHKLTLLQKEFSPVRFAGEMRCDLHPRVSPSGRYFSIDCIRKGRRAIKVMDISSLI